MVAIYNEVLATSTAIFSEEPVSAADVGARLEARPALPLSRSRAG